jgi:hypothetical protein
MSVTLSPLAGAGWQFFDNNGVPLAGGLLYTYASGTTTPLATYTTISGVTANSNPIVLDSAGRVPYEIWLTYGFGYKFVLKDANFTQIATWDNIPTNAIPPFPNDAANIAYEEGYTLTAGNFVVGQTYLITSVGTTNFVVIGAASNTTGIYFTATGVGSGTGTAKLSRSVESRLQESVYLKDFGAYLNGTTSDQVAFTAAVNSGASQINISGICYLTNSITVPSTTALQFAYGAKIKIESGQTLTIASQIIAENAPLFVSPFNVCFTGNQGQIKQKWLNT